MNDAGNAGRRRVYSGRVLNVDVEVALLPNGVHTDLEIVRHPGGAAILACADDGRVCLIRQYRHAFGDWLCEAPAGRLDPGERPEVTARRELEEEAGLRAARWTPLGRMLATPGFCDEVVHLYLARDLTPVPVRTEFDELIEVQWLPLAEAVARATDGRITDGKTVVALLRAAALLATGA